MTDYSRPAPELYAGIHEQVVTEIAGPGDWLTGAQRLDAWREYRDARTNPLDEARRLALSPASVDGSHGASDHLPVAAVEAVHRIASDPGRLTRAWADDLIAELGEETYTELVGVTAIVSAIDHFDEAIRGEGRDLPDPVPGEPTRIRPDDVGDIGAWVAQTIDKTRANVSRTLSLVPVTNSTWRLLVDSHYSRGAEFFEVDWTRALTRPQVELVAARVTALNECFY